MRGSHSLNNWPAKKEEGDPETKGQPVEGSDENEKEKLLRGWRGLI